jgi:phenylpyruvate tautomerase PptA (4-oxalocrotonate tautomerase family)
VSRILALGRPTYGVEVPLLRIDVNAGRSPEEIRVLLDSVQSAVVGAFGVPETDRYQVLTQHGPNELVALDTGLGIDRSDRLVMIQVVSKARPDDAKQELFRLLARNLERDCDLSPDDLVVTITDNGDADWSFGRGQAQFVTGELP